MVKISALKEKIQKNEVIYVAEINRVFTVQMVELISQSGFDFVWIDMEHSHLSLENLANLTIAAKACGVEIITRIADYGYTVPIKVLELGSKGIVVPHCLSDKDAQCCVRKCKFYPLGLRGMGGGRDSRYGATDYRKYIEEANNETTLIVMIEDVEAIDNIEEIAAVENIDILYVGPGDLSQSLGVPGEFRHVKIMKAIEKVGLACQKHKKMWGLPVSPGEEMRSFYDMGARFLCCASDVGVIYSGFQKAINTAKNNG